MEDTVVLDCLNMVHFIAVNHIYMEETNRRVIEYGWPTQRLKTVRWSLQALLTSGQLQNPVWFVLLSSYLNDYIIVDYRDDQTAGIWDRPIFAPLKQAISDHCKDILQSRIMSPTVNINHIIDDYLTCVNSINRHN
jgi:hypothetical protein